MRTPDLPKPAPDFNRLFNVITGNAMPDRLPLVDLLVDQPVKEQIIGRPTVSDFSNDPDEVRQRVDDEIEFRYKLGYDYVDIHPFVYFGAGFAISDNSDRTWMSESLAVIRCREDFEQRPWPDPDMVDFSGLEYAASCLPDGMMMIPRISGVFEAVSGLTGLEGLSYLLVDDPDLVREMFDKAGGVLLAIADRMVQMDRVGALFLGDDLGFNTGPLLSPNHLRQYVFPWHKKICGAAHQRNIPCLLHSCGNIEVVMEDLIGDVKIDARHSFQDAVVPIETAVERYSDRIALLGGVDMDLLARGTEEEVRRRVREIIEKCAPSGRFALGTGNSIASYLKIDNYLAMLDEAWRMWRSL